MIRKERPATRKNVKQGTLDGKKINYRTDQIIVKLKKTDSQEEDSAESFESISRRINDIIPGGEVLRLNERTGRAVFQVKPDIDLKKLITELGKRSDVDYAEYDVVDQIAVVIPNDLRYGDQWSHDIVRSERAWDITKGASSNILIGIIDSGISMNTIGSLDHPDLNSGKFILGTDFVDGGSPRDENAHGTHVVGIAAAETNNCTGIAGMNWETPVYICRTLDADGNGSSSDFADAVEEIVDYALANNLKVVINYSAGGGHNLTKRNACQYAHDNGMILCAATGNDNGGAVIFPAAYSVDFNGVIAVGSTDSDDTVSSFSNIGPEVTVVAPGRNILSTTPTYLISPSISTNYDSFDGTSMATPLVTGLVALMWSRRPALSNNRVRQYLVDTCVKLGPGTFNNSWGYGRVDAYEAVSSIILRTFCFTRFTRFTLFTRFTGFTRLTPFTDFTLFTPFTVFTRFTPFTEFTRPPIPIDPLELGPVRPFVRYKNTILNPDDLILSKFEAFQPFINLLSSLDINYLNELVVIDPAELEKHFGSTDKANYVVQLSQKFLNTMAS